MNLVSGYGTSGAAGSFYGGSSHINSTLQSHDLYGSPPIVTAASAHAQAHHGMGMTRYPYLPVSQLDGSNPETWSAMGLTHAHHYGNSSMHSSQHSAVIDHTTHGVTDMSAFHAQYTIQNTSNGYSCLPLYDVMPDGTVKVRVVKKRNCANKKERRRTISINTAFSALRGCIPNVPSDTKLSKIKTLRLATSYIAYLMDILNTDDPTLTRGGFKAEIAKKIENREERRKREVEEMLRTERKEELKRSKGRTGWPQAVWASELHPDTQTGNQTHKHTPTHPNNGSETSATQTCPETMLQNVSNNQSYNTRDLTRSHAAEYQQNNSVMSHNNSYSMMAESLRESLSEGLPHTDGHTSQVYPQSSPLPQPLIDRQSPCASDSGHSSGTDMVAL